MIPQKSFLLLGIVADRKGSSPACQQFSTWAAGVGQKRKLKRGILAGLLSGDNAIFRREFKQQFGPIVTPIYYRISKQHYRQSNDCGT